MAKMTLNKQGCDWLRKHDACGEGYKWAAHNCATLDDVWATAKPEWLIWVATREGCLDDKALRLFAVWSARQVQHLMTDPRSIAALDVAERHANGTATDAELAAAWAAARDAARAARDAAWAAWDAAGAARDAAGAARDAAGAARDAAGAARDAAWAAWDTAWAAREAAGAAGDAARDAQAAYIRANCAPNWRTTVPIDTPDPREVTACVLPVTELPQVAPSTAVYRDATPAPDSPECVGWWCAVWLGNGSFADEKAVRVVSRFDGQDLRLRFLAGNSQPSGNAWWSHAHPIRRATPEERKAVGMEA